VPRPDANFGIGTLARDVIESNGITLPIYSSAIRRRTRLTERDIADSLAYSRNRHRIFERVESSRVRIVSVLHGSGYGRNAIPEN